MSIWRNATTLEELQGSTANTLIELLGIRFTEIGPDYLRAAMPVDARTHQPTGVLHGGASVALAETLGSTAANLCVDRQRELCLGQEINANHLRSVAAGRSWMEDCVFRDSTRSDRYPRSELTAREQEVLELVEQGCKNKEIAQELGIRPGTVKIHLKHIFEKTGVRGRYGLALNVWRERSEAPVPA